MSSHPAESSVSSGRKTSLGRERSAGSIAIAASLAAFSFMGGVVSAGVITSLPSDASPYVATTGAFPPSAIPTPKNGGDGVWDGGSSTIAVGNRSNAGQTAAVFVFQLPNVGAVSDPFTSASFSVVVEGSNAPFAFNPFGNKFDLYGIGRRASDAVVAGDFFLGSAGSDATVGTSLIQAGFVDGLNIPGYSPDSIPGNTTITTDSAGSAALLNYLNAQYAAGAGAGQYAFLRINANNQSGSFSGATFYTGDASSNLPSISFQIVAVPEPTTFAGAAGIAGVVLFRRRAI